MILNMSFVLLAAAPTLCEFERMAAVDSKNPPEHLTRAAAERLARRIEQYLAARGKTVTARVEQESPGPAKGNMLYVVRSDLASHLDRKPPSRRTSDLSKG
jgi:hypothetical protein